jgi:dihydrofolate synthase/folylpolyglutamate synthase
MDQPDFSSFESTMTALFSRVRGRIEPGSHRMMRLLRRETLERINEIPTCLVAGTNGKGSVCALLEYTFRSSGMKTALYTSPHLVSPTERIRFNGVPVSKERVLQTAQNVFEAAKCQLPDATFFELMTAIAFELTAAECVDVFVCEVGLGGRLDSTNVLSPVLSVLTSIGLDHTEWLGENEEKIGFEKAFIARRNRPFIVGPCSSEAKLGIQKALGVIGADAKFLDDLTSVSSNSHWAMQICAEVLKQWNQLGHPRLSLDVLADAQKNFFWPGRFDRRVIDGTPLLLDAAHNSHAMGFFLRRCQEETSISRLPRPWVLLYATLSDKDWRICLEKLHSSFNEIHLTQTRNPRAVHPNELLHYTHSLGLSQYIFTQESAPEALDFALSRAKNMKGTLFVIGSLTLLGETMEHLSLPVFPSSEAAGK